MKTLLVLLAFATAASGCMSFSGLGGSSQFACKAPDGVSCTSVSGVYANPPDAVDAQAAPEKGKPKDSKAAAPALPVYPASSFFHAQPASGTPLLTPPRVLRIWVAPWKDQDGDLRDQSYLYVMWDRGEWNVRHTREQIQRQYAPVRLRAAPAASAPARQDQAGAMKASPEMPETVPEIEHVE